MTTVVQQGQNLYDVSIMIWGSIEGVFALAVANDCRITDELEVGRELIVPSSSVGIKTGVLKVLRDQGVTVATAYYVDGLYLVDEDGGIIVDEGGGGILIG